MEEEEKVEEKEERKGEPIEDRKEAPNIRPTSAGRRIPKKRKRLRLVIIIIVILAILGGGAWFLLREPSFDEEDLEDVGTVESIEIQEPTSSPTPIVEPIDKEEISIEILNGTGIPKEASSLSDEVGELGYAKIEVGNADNKDYQTTEVFFASSVADEVKDEITELLEDIYKDVEVKTGSAGSVDIRIIIGFKKGQTVTPTPKPTSTSTPTPTPSDDDLTPTVAPIETPIPLPTT